MDVVAAEVAPPKEPYARQPPHPPLVWNPRRHGGTAITLAHAHASVQHALQKGVPGYRVRVGGDDAINGNSGEKDGGQGDDGSEAKESNEIDGGEVGVAAAAAGGGEEAARKSTPKDATLQSPVPLHHAVDFGKHVAGRRFATGGGGTGKRTKVGGHSRIFLHILHCFGLLL